jgi:predicted nuclease of restriction endonuclease-like RecB superfamily
MLTSEMGLQEYDFARGLLIPDRLMQSTHADYLVYAERMLRAYGQGLGKARRDLHFAVQDIFADVEDCPTRRVLSFCKLLDDASDYASDKAGEAAKLRQRVFQLAARYHPLVSNVDRLYEHSEQAVKQKIAAALDRPWDWIAAHLFADVIEFHVLTRFRGYDSPSALLARYNVAQVQVALFRAHDLVVWAQRDLKAIVRYAKLARLMHSITRSKDGEYELRFDGPASVLRETRRYGVAMARFLPGLITCEGWRMQATIKIPRISQPLQLRLGAADRLRSPAPAPEEFDSDLEEDFARRWGPEPRDGWRLEREAEVLSRGQRVFIPDFVLRHESGACVLLEVVGFWTPEYLQAKAETLQLFRETPVLLAVAESTVHRLPPLPTVPLTFKSAVRPEEVLVRLRGLPRQGEST